MVTLRSCWAFAVQTTEQDDPENPPQEAMLAMIAALQAAKGFDQKQAGKANDVASENSEALTRLKIAMPCGYDCSRSAWSPYRSGKDGDTAKGNR